MGREQPSKLFRSHLGFASTADGARSFTLGRMKAVTLLLLWLLGSATAIGVAWSGVGVLDDDLVAPAPAAVNEGGEVGLVSDSIDPFAEDASNKLRSDRATLAVTGDDTPDAVDDGSTSSTTSPASSTTTAGGTSISVTTATTDTIASTHSTGTAVTTRGGSGSSSTTATTSAAAVPEQYVTKIFTLVGGTTAIRFSPSATKVLWATPDPGYEVRIEPESPGLKVEFRSDGHRSRVDAWWDNGPRHEIHEED